MNSRYMLLMICLSCALVGGWTGTVWAQGGDPARPGNGSQTGPKNAPENADNESDADDEGDEDASSEGQEHPSGGRSHVELENTDPNMARDVRPWAVGVSTDDRSAATELFAVGNRALDVGDFGGAEESFMNALDHWNHPAIQYNLVLALIGKKDDPVRIYKALKEAIRFGEPPLEPTRYKQALQYEAIYSNQLATLELRCDAPDTKVTVDGRLVLTGPGHFKDFVTVGEHRVSATKNGYIAINKTLKLKTDDAMKMDLVMYTLADRTRYERHFKPWLPWTTAGSGVAVLAVAATLHYLSLENRTSYQKNVERDCPEGCRAGYDKSLLERADLQQTSAYIGYGLGGVVAAAGALMIYLNQPRKIVEIDDLTDTPLESTAFVPIIGPDRVGVSAIVSF